MLNTRYEYDQRPASPEPARIDAHDDTCLSIGCPDVDVAYDYLREKVPNVKPPKVTHYGMKQLYIKDPDGFGICFQWETLIRPRHTPSKSCILAWFVYDLSPNPGRAAILLPP